MAIDLKDRKILYELDFEARQSLSNIGKKVGLPAEVVHYRIKKLEKEGIITGYNFMVDLAKLGRQQYKLYLRLQHCNANIKGKIIRCLMAHDNVKWLVSCQGAFDLIMAIETNSISDFDEVKEDILSKIDKYVLEKSITTLIEASAYRRTYFLSKEFSEEKALYVMGKQEKIDIDKTDMEILKTLAKKGRISIIEIAMELSMTPRIISYRIKQLEKKGVILGCRITLNYEKLGLKFLKALIYLERSTKQKINTLKEYCRRQPNIIHCVKVLGNWDIEPEFEVYNIEDYYRIIEEIQNNFSGIIKRIDTVMITKEHKFSYF
jgi:DNA-binding Lrp family transcriptional regulator